MNEIVSGIEYTLPEVTLLQETGIGTSEIAARTCYDSFDKSENDCIRDFEPSQYLHNQDLVNSIDHSALLDTLAWTHFHYSILEHINLTFLIKGTSRGVLQEHARHRIQGISVRSTRYTMSDVINVFVASLATIDDTEAYDFFIKYIRSLNLFVTKDEVYNDIEIDAMYSKLMYQYDKLGNTEFLKIAVAKSNITTLKMAQTPKEVYKVLQDGKKKRNVGDNFKHLVTDNWKVDLVVTFNLRSLKNYYQLRDSGAAYFQIQWLAKAMKKSTPKKYLDLIVKTK